jgi:hypothetical protein
VTYNEIILLGHLIWREIIPDEWWWKWCSTFWNDEEDDLAMVTLIGGESVVYPYVSFTVNLPT